MYTGRIVCVVLIKMEINPEILEMVHRDGPERNRILNARRESVSKTVKWHSCCFTMDKLFVMYIVQTVVGTALLSFSAYRLTTEPDCDRASPYWGLIGTLCGFFFKQVSTQSKSPAPDVTV
jgi:hypothetical protein